MQGMQGPSGMRQLGLLSVPGEGWRLQTGCSTMLCVCWYQQRHLFCAALVPVGTVAKPGPSCSVFSLCEFTL